MKQFPRIVAKIIERVGGLIEAASNIIEEFGKKGTAQALFSSCFSWLKSIAEFLKNISTDIYTELKPEKKDPKTGGAADSVPHQGRNDLDYFQKMVASKSNERTK